MKQAFLIIAHNNFEQLKILLSLLDNNKFSFFIHIDKKCKIDLNEIKNYCTKSDVHVYSEYDIRWATFSQTICEIYLLEKALETGDYEYFHLLSGVDLPLTDSNTIYNFFHTKNKEFVHFESASINNKKLEFVKYYYPLLKIKKFKNSKVLKGLNRVLVKLQKIIRIDRTKNSNICYYTGANWFSITNEFANYLISRKKFIIDQYKYSRNSDEMFLQTEIMNSKYKNNLYYNKMDNNYIACMRYIDWNRGKPYTWTLNDFDELIHSKFLFARKFDWNIDKEIIIKIKEYIENK